MFERFTERARRVMGLANEQAQRYNHEYIKGQHILLGLTIERSGVGVQVLENLGLNMINLKRGIENIITTEEPRVAPGRLPIAQTAKKVIEHSINYARELNMCNVGTEHLVGGLLTKSPNIEEQGPAYDVLNDKGVDFGRYDEALRGFLGPEEDQSGGMILEFPERFWKTPQERKTLPQFLESEGYKVNEVKGERYEVFPQKGFAEAISIIQTGKAPIIRYDLASRSQINHALDLRDLYEYQDVSYEENPSREIVAFELRKSSRGFLADRVEGRSR